MNQMMNSRQEMTVVSEDVDRQIATAHKFRRNQTQALKDINSLALQDLETAESCFYSLERTDKKGKKTFIKGPSVRLAEIVASQWGNMRSQAFIVDQDNKFVTARGQCWDLQNNNAVSMDVKRRITDRNGKTFSDDLILVTSNAACSIAFRNSIFRIVPQVFIQPTINQVIALAVGDKSNFVKRVEEMFAAFAKIDVTPEMILKFLGKQTPKDVDIDDLGGMRGIFTAIRDGERDVEEVFQMCIEEPTSRKTYSSKSAELADRDDDDDQDKGKGESGGSEQTDNNPGGESGQESDTPSGDDSGKTKYSGVVGNVSEEPPKPKEGEIIDGDRRFFSRSSKKSRSDKSNHSKSESIDLMDDCRDFLKLNDLRCVQADGEKGIYAYLMPDNTNLVLTIGDPSDPKENCTYVNTSEPDALNVVKHVLERSKGEKA